MNPRLPALNRRNLCLRDVVSPSHVCLSHLSAQRPNFKNLGLGQLGFPVGDPVARGDQAEPIGVTQIFGSSYPFEITGTSVGFITVNVIDLAHGQRGSKEGMSDHRVNPSRGLSKADTNHDCQIARPVYLRLKGESAFPMTTDEAHPLDPSKIRHLVPAFKAGGGSPLFGGRIQAHRASPRSVSRPRLLAQRGGFVLQKLYLVERT
jgi:hypothetical protein